MYLADGTTKVGSGPITTASDWQMTRRLSRAGEFSFTMPAADPKSALIVGHPGRVVRAFGQVEPLGARTELGAGVVQQWEHVPAADGTLLHVSGADLLRQLTWTPAGFFNVWDGSSGGSATALADIVALAAGWSVDPAGALSTGNLDYGSFAGESVLEALIKLAEHDGHAFRLGDGKSIRWVRNTQFDLRISIANWSPLPMQNGWNVTEDVTGANAVIVNFQLNVAPTPSYLWVSMMTGAIIPDFDLLYEPGTGVFQTLGNVIAVDNPQDISTFAAIQASDPIAAEGSGQALITQLAVAADAWDMITALRPYGAGNGRARLTLAKCSRTVPDGITLDAANNLLVNATLEAELGTRIERYLSWKEIAPITNSEANLTSAANVLFDAALQELRLRSEPVRTFRLSLVANRIVYPGEQVRVIWHGWAPIVDGQGNTTGRYHFLNIDEVLLVLESQDQGQRSVGLVVSTAARQADTDAELAAQQMEAGRLYEAHPQLSLAYAPVGPHVLRMDSTHHAQFTVRIGKECTFLNYAIVRFKTSPLKSSIKAVSGASGGGATATSTSGGSSTPTSSAGGASAPTSGSTGGAVTFGGQHDHRVDISAVGGGDVVRASGSGTYLVADNAHSFYTATVSDHEHEFAPHTHTVTIGDHTHTVSVPAHTHDVTLPDHTHTMTATYGIYQDGSHPTTISLYIDGVNRSAALGGPWAGGGGAADIDELDITAYLVEAAGGLRQRHTLEFRCASGQGEIEAEVDMLVTVQAIVIV